MEKFLSASKLAAFDACPFQYSLGQTVKKAKILKDGEAAHKAIEKFLKDEPLTEAQEAYIAKTFTPDFVGKLLQLTDATEKIEEQFTFPFMEFTITGIIDYLRVKDKMAIITDWKTGKRFFRNSHAATSLQGKIYAIYAFEQLGVHDAFFEIAMTHHRSTAVVKYNVTEHLGDIASDLQYVINEFRASHDNNNFPALPGSHCQYCDFIKTCKNNATYRPSPCNDITTDKQLEDAICTYETTKAYIEKLGEYINAYIDSKDEFNTKAFNIVKEVKHGYKISSSKAAKEYMATKFPQLLRPDTTEIKKLILDNPELRNEAITLGLLKNDDNINIEWVRK